MIWEDRSSIGTELASNPAALAKPRRGSWFWNLISAACNSAIFVLHVRVSDQMVAPAKDDEALRSSQSPRVAK